MKRALVTIAFTEKYLQGFEKYVYPNWRKYAERWAYDIKVIASPIDCSERAIARSIAWQKCLIFEVPALSSYERLAWLDCDILINPEAPDLFDGLPPESVGAVQDINRSNILGDINSEEQKFNRRNFHMEAGLPGTFDSVVQTGVLALNRTHHAATLRYVYDHYEDKGGNEWNFEMRPMSYELQSRHTIHWLDARFNVPWVAIRDNFYSFVSDKHDYKLWSILGPNRNTFRFMIIHECIQACLKKSYFLHFAGTGFQELPFSSELYVLDICKRKMLEQLANSKPD